MKYIQSLNFDWIEILNFYERPFRAKFIPAKIWNELDSYRNDPDGLVNYVKKWRTKIVWKKELSKAKMYETYIAIGGEYDPEKTQSILFIYTDNYKHFNFTKDSWDKFKYRFLQTLMHEIIHCRQYYGKHEDFTKGRVYFKKTGIPKIDNNREYHAGKDEIEAYAHCVFLDFKTFRPNVDIPTLISRAKTHSDSKTLHWILRTFNYDYRNNKAIPKIMQQIIKWDRKYKRISSPK